MNCITKYGFSLATMLMALPIAIFAREADATKTNQHQTTQEKAPLAFIENKGQITDQDGNPRRDIQFRLSTQPVNMFIGNGELHYQWYLPPAPPKEGGHNPPKQHNVTPLSIGEGKGEVYRLDVELLNANKNAEIITEEKLDYFENYYLPQCPDGATAHSYKKITYKNIYPNIDWEILTSPNPSKGGGLKYNFIVHEGGDYKKIQIRYNGATSLELVDGSLIATTPFGSITENAPYTYYADSKKETTSNFILNGNILSYNIASHVIPSSFGGGREEVSGSLIIDPYIYFLEYASYYGGNHIEAGNAICNDNEQHIFLAGETQSPDNIATSGAFQNGISNIYYSDGFLVKFSSTGARLWATYYGGTYFDMFKAIACDSAGNIYAAGNTNSESGVSTTGCQQYTYGGKSSNFYYGDGMLIKFDNANGQRVWGTYYGGTANEFLSGITVLKNAVYIAGGTYSPNNISTPGTFKPTADTGSLRGFVAKFNLSGSRQWGTYYGNTGWSQMICYAADMYDTNSVYVSCAGYLIKISNTGALVWEQQVNGNCYTVATDKSGNVYTAGETSATSGIATIGTHKTFLTNPGSSNPDAFIVSYTPNGTKRWGTYYGGDSLDVILGIDIADRIGSQSFQGGVWVTGRTQSAAGIATSGSIHDTLCGHSLSSWADAFAANFTSTGQLAYASYFGGSHFDEGNAVLCPQGSASAWIAGTTFSDTGIAMQNSSHQSYYGSWGQSSLQRGDAFLAELIQKHDTVIGIPVIVQIKLPFIDTAFCQGDSFNLAYSVFTTFRPGNTFEVWICSPVNFPPFAPPVLHTKIGSVNATSGGTIACKIPLSLQADTSYIICVRCDSPSNGATGSVLYAPPVPGMRIKRMPGFPVATNNSPICEGDTLLLFATDSSLVGYEWKGPKNLSASAQNIQIHSASLAEAGDYIVYASYNGCGRYDTTTAVINPAPHLQEATSNSPICVGDSLFLYAKNNETGISYKWSGPQFSSNGKNPTIENAIKAYEGIYKVTATRGSCTEEDTTLVKIGIIPKIDVSSNSPLCEGDTLVLQVIDTNTGDIYSWSGPDDFKGNQKIIHFPGATTILSGLYTLKAGDDRCFTTDTITAIVNPVPDIQAGNNGPVWTGEQLQLYSTSTLTGVNYNWTGPNGFTSSEQTPVIYGVRTTAAGTYIVTAEANGCSKSDITVVTIRKTMSDSMMVLFPNPSVGKLTLIGNTVFDQVIPIEILTVDGKIVHTAKATSQNNIVYAEITLPGSLANGVYMLRIRFDGKTRTLGFVLGK